MRTLKQEIYFPIIIGIHFVIWAIDLYFYQGNFMEISSDTMFFGELTNESWKNSHRILGEVFSSWVVTVFAANFLMATRAKWIEKIFGGLDKMYLIHRRSGVIAMVLLLAHFFIVPRDLTEFTPGKPLGFYALVLIIIGVILSAAPPLKKKIPYHKWINIHRLMGVFYVLAVLHGIMVKSLIKELPLTRIYVFGMAFIGVAAWFYKAFLYRLFNKSLDYTISSVTNKGNNTTEVHLIADNTELQYAAGQFAFFKFLSINKKEQHPFTISSHPSQNQLRVTIKDLGDYTHEIKKLKVGDKAQIEGPFGLFSSENSIKEEQIWIAGGIGITPFLSLSKENVKTKTKLFWCVNNRNEAIYSNELNRIATDNSNFEVIIWDSDNKGYLTADKLDVKQYDNKAYLICGPEVLKESLINQLATKGVCRESIHDEEFSFR